MQLTCEQCGKSFDLPEHKVPAGQKLRFACPACGEKNIVSLTDNGDNQLDKPTGEQTQQSVSSSLQSSIEPDIYPPGSEVAFIYLFDSVWEERSKQHLEGYGYYVSVARDNSEAAQKLSLNKYSFILLEDVPENKNLLDEVANWPGATRREINCVLIGNKAASFDPQQALLRGVNSYVNIEQRDSIEQLLDSCLEYFKTFYEPWKMAREAEVKDRI